MRQPSLMKFSMPNYELKPLSQEEGDALTAEMLTLLEKYNAEMNIRSNIEIMQRVEVSEEVPSPYAKEEPEPQTEESSDRSGEEPTVEGA